MKSSQNTLVINTENPETDLCLLRNVACDRGSISTRAERMVGQQMLWGKLTRFFETNNVRFLFTPFTRINARCIKEISTKKFIKVLEINMHKYFKNQMVKEALLSKKGNLETESK